MTKGNQKLADEILDLAGQLMIMKLSPGVVERQFFFNFWCQDYLDGIGKLRTLLSADKKSVEDLLRKALYDRGFDWLARRFPQGADLITELSERFGIAWQDILQHIAGTLPLAGYPRYELHRADSDETRSILVTPGASTLVIHDPSTVDLEVLEKYLSKEFVPHRRRKKYASNHIRTCACLCLADRAYYGNRGALRLWRTRFPERSYIKGLLIPNQINPGETQFSREKRKLLERFRQLEHGGIRFIQSADQTST
jgi:hypothetical protein